MALDIVRRNVHEQEFIRFCQDVAHDSHVAPYWSKNLNHFNRIFLKYRDHGKSHIPILSFIEKYRSQLQQPIVVDSDPNDKWLLFDEDEPIPESKSWASTKPRGIFLPMKDEDWNHCIPLSEIYADCVRIAESNRRSFTSVTADTVPAKFLYLFYQMLVEVEPDNAYFKENMTLCDEIITPYSDMPDIGSTLGSIMNSEGAKQLQGMLQGVTSSIDDSVKADVAQKFGEFAQTGDISGLFQSFQPILQQSGLQSLLSGMLPSGNPDVPAGDSGPLVEEGDAEDQD